MTPHPESPLSERRGLAVVTGASSGIGAATARQLAGAGFDLLLGARREDRLDGVAGAITAATGRHVLTRRLDVTDEASVAAFAAAAPTPAVEVLVANAGGAKGLAPVAEVNEADWRWMWEANVLGLAWTIRAFLPALEASGDGRIAVVTSVAGHQPYPGGAGYTGVKHAAAVITETLRVELLGHPIRVCEIAPGLVDTEFSTVRFGGDTERAAGVYAGLTPLVADDVADAITWAVTRPAHVTVARLDLFPRDQAGARDVHRRSPA